MLFTVKKITAIIVKGQHLVLVIEDTTEVGSILVLPCGVKHSRTFWFSVTVSIPVADTWVERTYKARFTSIQFCMLCFREHSGSFTCTCVSYRKRVPALFSKCRCMKTKHHEFSHAGNRAAFFTTWVSVSLSYWHPDAFFSKAAHLVCGCMWVRYCVRFTHTMQIWA